MLRTDSNPELTNFAKEGHFCVLSYWVSDFPGTDFNTSNGNTTASST